MSEEPGASSSEMRSTTSWGISMRSRTALAWWGADTGGMVSTAWLPCVRCLEGGGDFSGIDTTVQRNVSAPFWDLISVNIWVPSDCSGCSILIGISNNGVKPCRTKSLLNLRLTKTETGTSFPGATAPCLEPGAWRLATCCVSALEVEGGCTATVVMAALSAMAAPDSGGAEAAFGLDTKSFGWAISTGPISSDAMITRVPRLVRCHSRMANSFFKRIQPCEAGCPGRTPACSAIPDQVMRCIYGIGAAL